MIAYASGAALGAAAHRLRGSGWKLWIIPNRLTATLCIAGAVMLFSGNHWPALITAAGYFFYISFGWGAYFITPEDFRLERVTEPREKEIGWIDRMIVKLPPYDLLRNAAGMFLRSLFLMPLFAVLAVLQWSLIPLFWGVAAAVWITAGYVLFPFIAHATGKDFDQTAYAEAWAGAGIVLAVFGALT